MRGSPLMSPLYDWPTGLGQIVKAVLISEIFVFRNSQGSHVKDLRLADHYTTREKEGLRCTKIKLRINRIIYLNYLQFEDGDRLFTDFS